MTYTNWFTASSPSEPDNSGGAQDYIRENVNWQWDDFSNDPSNPSVQYISGYFVEYGTVSKPAAVGLVMAAAALIPGRGRGRGN